MHGKPRTFAVQQPLRQALRLRCIPLHGKAPFPPVVTSSVQSTGQKRGLLILMGSTKRRLHTVSERAKYGEAETTFNFLHSSRAHRIDEPCEKQPCQMIIRTIQNALPCREL